MFYPVINSKHIQGKMPMFVLKYSEHLKVEKPILNLYQ